MAYKNMKRVFPLHVSVTSALANINVDTASSNPLTATVLANVDADDLHIHVHVSVNVSNLTRVLNNRAITLNFVNV